MLELLLVRHGMTAGNKLSRYIGRGTDEPLSDEGKQMLSGHSGEIPQLVYVSPMLRCRQSAEIIFPGCPLKVVEELAECDFGEFENKNYQELDGNEAYQKWIDSNGTLPFPGGESREEFRTRNLLGFQKVLEHCFANEIKRAALVIHGGTIMNIMENLTGEEDSFYRWHVKNGEGYVIGLSKDEQPEGRNCLAFYRKI
ncbi:MAG: histidine phosphatase family protein [Blautia sp.]|nr:histidine phosphatase family protein [Blautia sp.]